MVGARSLKAPANVCLQLRPIFIYKRTLCACDHSLAPWA